MVLRIMVAGSNALTINAQMSAHAGSLLRKCWWKVMDSCSKPWNPLSQNKLRTYNSCKESIEINVLVGVLSDLLTRRASQLSNFVFGILLRRIPSRAK